MPRLRSLLAPALCLSMLAAVPAANAAAPVLAITKVTVNPPTSEEPGMMPSLTKPRVSIEGTGIEGCTASEFRYANEDGTWKPATVNRARPYITPTPGYGLKGVYVQLVASCSNGSVQAFSNVVYTKYTIRRLATTAPTTVTTPTITKVTVQPPMSEEPGMMPSLTRPNVYIEHAGAEGCTVSDFRYANEDGNWKPGAVSRTRPYLAPTSGYGLKGVYVQLVGTCDGGATVGPLGNVVYTKYTIKRLADAPVPASEPTITKVTVTPPSTDDGAMMPSMSRPNLHITRTAGPGCNAWSFRYANEDGNWQREQPTLARPYIVPSAGYGIKGVYVQLIASCGENAAPRPVGDIVFVKYTIRRLGH